MPEGEVLEPKFGNRIKSILGKLRSLRRKDRSGQLLPGPDVTSENHDPPSPLAGEPISVQFPLSDYRYFRDGLQQLQEGFHYNPDTDKLEDLILQGETKESGSHIGLTGNNIARRTISELREGRINKDGQPYILCVDEVSDTQVLQGAAPQDRENSLKGAILNLINSLYLSSSEFLTAAVATASVLTGKEVEEAKELVQQAIEASNLESGKRSNFTHELQNLTKVRIDKLLAFIKESKPRLIDEERRHNFKHGPSKYGSFEEAYEASAETGEPLFGIEGQEFSAPSAGGEQYTLDSKDVKMVLPLREAIQHSRQEMIRQARLAALLYLGLEPDPNYNASPPGWWINRESMEGLRSDEVLVFVPYEVSEDKKADYPPLLREFERGWYLLKIPYDSDRNLRLKKISKLGY